MFYFVRIFLGLTVFSVFSLLAETSLVDQFIDSVEKTVEATSSLSSSKEDIFALLKVLREEGHAESRGLDAKERPIFVSTQGAIENLLSLWLKEGRIVSVAGSIHTPMPATPLCTEGTISHKLVDSSMIDDDRRLYTVASRAQIIREYLDRGGVLIIAYPKGGLSRRTVEQQMIYRKGLKKYPRTLIDAQLDALTEEMIGATYIARTADEQYLLFSIRASQANAPSDTHKWEMWFSSVDNSAVVERVEAVFDFIATHRGPRIERFVSFPL